MGNRQRKREAAAAFNAKREADIAERARKQAEYEAKLATPEGRAELQRERDIGRRPLLIAAIAAGSFPFYRR